MILRKHYAEEKTLHLLGFRRFPVLNGASESLAQCRTCGKLYTANQVQRMQTHQDTHWQQKGDK